MSGVLVIGDDERRIIDTAVATARAKPAPWSVMQELAVETEGPTLNLDERRVPPERVAEIMREYPSHRVQLGTYSAAISFEEQPSGLMRHLSVSYHAGKIPNLAVIEMVCEAFGFSDFPPTRPHRIWIEEFEPGHHAVNVVELEL